MSRRVTIRTAHDEPGHLARAIGPDNTDEIETRVDDGAVVTTIERETTSGLQATVDDYVVNLEVAIDVLETTERTQIDHATRTDDSPRTTRTDDPTRTDDTSEATRADHSTRTNRADHPADAGTVSDDDNTTNNE